MPAILSQCRKYRYSLSRDTGLLVPEKGTALFVMLNPSTADESKDDPTIRRCKGFATRWDCNGFIVGNLYALRATNPKELWKAGDPIGPDNDYHLQELMAEIKEVVCAWGNNARPDRVKAFVDIANKVKANLWCLGITKEGQPKHPLYVKAEQELISWRPQ
jgi:hypothetical protein